MGRNMKLPTLTARTLQAVFEENEPNDVRKHLFFDLNGQPISYAIFYNRVQLVSERLRKQGVQKGDLVAILSENLANWAIAYFSIALVGAAALPIDLRWDEETIRNILEKHRVKLAFVSQSAIARLAELKIEHPKFLVLMENFGLQTRDERSGSFQEIIGRELEKIKKSVKDFIGRNEEEALPEAIDEDTICSVLQVSGADGQKEVRLSHKNVLSVAMAAARALDLPETTRLMVLLPLSLPLPTILGILLPLFAGTQAIFLPEPENEKQLKEWLQTFRPTHILTDTAFVRRLHQLVVLRTGPQSWLEKTVRFVKGLLKKEKQTDAPIDISFFKKFYWLICTSEEPVGPAVQRFLLTHSIQHRLLLGTPHTTSLFVTGKASREFLWLKGNLLPDLQMRIVAAHPEAAFGELWLKGDLIARSVVEEQKLWEGFWATGFVALPAEEELKILGRVSDQISGEDDDVVFGALICAALKETKWVQEARVFQNNGAFEAEVTLKEHSESAWRRIQKNLLKQVNAVLPPTVQLANLHLKTEDRS